MARRETSFVCQNCGAAYSRWQGKCDACGEWNTIELLCVGGTSVHIVNGKVNMILTNSRHVVNGKEVRRSLRTSLKPDFL